MIIYCCADCCCCDIQLDILDEDPHRPPQVDSSPQSGGREGSGQRVAATGRSLLYGMTRGFCGCVAEIARRCRPSGRTVRRLQTALKFAVLAITLGLYLEFEITKIEQIIAGNYSGNDFKVKYNRKLIDEYYAKVKKKNPASMSASEVYHAHLKDYHHKVPWMLDPMRNFNLFLNNGFAECILSICSITIIFDFCISFTFKHALFRLRRSDFERIQITRTVLIISSIFVMASFECDSQSEYFFQYALLLVHMHNFMIFETLRQKTEIHGIAYVVNQPYFMASVVTMCSLYFFHLMSLSIINVYLNNKEFTYFNIMVGLKMLAIDVITLGSECLIYLCHSSGSGFSAKLAISAVADVVILLADISATCHLFKANVRLKRLRRYYGMTFYLLKFFTILGKIIYRLYTCIKVVANIYMAERRFKRATAQDLESYDEMCSICYEKLEDGRVLPCKHIFHNTCIKEWLFVDRTCPLCRRNCFTYNPDASQTDAANNDNEGNQPIFQLNLRQFISFLPVIEIYNGDLPNLPVANNNNNPNAAPQNNANPTLNNLNARLNNNGIPDETLTRMVGEVMEMFPGVAPARVRQSLIRRRTVENVVNHILEHMQLYEEEPPEETPQVTESKIQQTESDERKIFVSQREYDHVKRMEQENRDDPNLIIIQPFCVDKDTTLRQKKHLMIKQSRRKYLLKNQDRMTVKPDLDLQEANNPFEEIMNNQQ